MDIICKEWSRGKISSEIPWSRQLMAIMNSSVYFTRSVVSDSGVAVKFRPRFKSLISLSEQSP